MAKREEDLASILADCLNKQNKDGKIAYFLNDEGGDAPTNVKDWISTGNAMLDVAISNRPYGGFPVGRICEITGLEQSGKSLLSAHILAETQRKGGVAVLIDTETAVSREYLEAIGVDISKLLYVSVDTVEGIFEACETIIEKVRTGDKDRLVTIVVDSVMGASTKIEMAAEFDKDGWATSKAIILSKGMRKITNMIAREKICLIFTNQLRARLGVSFGDPWTTSGGKAIPFHASVRLRLKSVGQIKAKDAKGFEQIIGIKTRAQVIKNRMGPPLKSIDYDIYFESGVDNYGGWLEVMKEYKLVTQAGAWYTYTRQDGTTVKFLSKDFEKNLEADVTLKEEIYTIICNAYIFKYQSRDIGIDDITIESDFINEES